MRMLLLLLLSLWLTSDNTEAGFRAEFNYLISETPSQGGDYRLKGLFVDGDALGFSVDSVNVGYYFYDSRGLEFEIVYSNKMQPLIIEVDRVGHNSAPTTGIGLLTDRTTNISLPYETSKISQKLQSFIESEVRYDIDDSNLLRLADLIDVDTTGEATGSVLLYDATSGNWEAQANSIDNLTDGYKNNNNMLIGSEPLSVITGANNTSMGIGAGLVITSGKENTNFGNFSGRFNYQGERNTNIGYEANISDTIGKHNINIGAFANSTLTWAPVTGSTNFNQPGLVQADSTIVIGVFSRTLTRTPTNEIVLGSFATGNGSNTATLGNNNITATYLKGTTNLRGYGLGNKEATDLTKTRSAYIAAFATDGTLLELDTTGLFGGISGGASDLGSLSDIDTTNKQDGSILVYNSGTSNWEAQANSINNLTDGYYQSGNLALPYNGQTIIDFNQTILGNTTLQQLVSGGSNTVVGAEGMRYSTYGQQNTVVGRQAGRKLNGDDNVLIGKESGFISDGTPTEKTLEFFNGVFIGQAAWAKDTVSTNEIVIGSQATGNGSNTATLGNNSITATYLKGTTNLRGYGLGNKEASDLSKTATDYVLRPASDGTILEQVNNIDGLTDGYKSGNSVFLGGSIPTQMTGVSNTRLGIGGGNITTGRENTDIGAFAGHYNKTGEKNVNIGYEANTTDTIGLDNIVIGNLAQSSNAWGQNFNVPGYVNASQTIIIGKSAKTLTRTPVNEIVIGAYATGNGSNTVTLGNNSITATYLKGTTNLRGYGVGNKEATDLTKTRSRYIAAFATDGTLLELDTTGLFGGVSGGGFTLPTDSITFNDNNQDAVAGKLQYDTEYGTLVFGMQNNTPLHIGSDLGWYVVNATGVTIGKGVPVYASGVDGNSGKIQVSPMIANNSIPAKLFLGVTAEAINSGAEGFVWTQGKIRGVDLSAYSQADILYVSPTSAGLLTATEPAAPNLKLPIGFVVNNTANGTLAIRSTIGNYLFENHDVQISGASSGQVLKYDGTKWVNGTDEIGTDTNLGNSDLTMSGTGGIRTATFDNNTLNIEAQGGNINLGNLDINDFSGSYLRLNNSSGNTLMYGGLIYFGGDQTEVAGTTTGGKLQLASYGRGLQQNPDDAYLLSVDAAGFVQEIPVGDYLTSEVDGSVTNEGALSVTAGTGTTSVINSNTSGSTPVTLSVSTGLSIGEAGNTITLTNTAPDQTVSLTGAGITAISGTYPNFTITSTEVDGSVTNEGSLSVTAGASNTSVINSNTSGSTPVTLTASTGLTIGESGNTITLTNSAPEATTAGDGLTLDGSQVRLGGTIGTSRTVTLNADNFQFTSSNLDAGYYIDNVGNNFRIYGQALLANYGSGSYTGTVSKILGVTSSGEVVETTVSGGGISLTDLSVTTAAAGTSALSYNNTNGVFTFTPPDLSSYLTSEVDGSVTNEGSLSVTAGTGTTSVINSNTSGSAAVTLEASTGLSIGEVGNTITLTNTAPDQTVSLTGAGITAISGTYPNFTITSTEVDGSVSNEGALSASTLVSGTIARLTSNTNGGSNVDFSAGTGIAVGSSGGNTISITNSLPEATTASGGLTETGNNIALGGTLNSSTVLTLPTDGTFTIANTGGDGTGFTINEGIDATVFTGLIAGTDYGSGTREAADIGKTNSAYFARFATDGTVVESTALTSEVDGSISNEGVLSIGTGVAGSSVFIQSNTSTSTPVTISVGDGFDIAASGSTIFLNPEAYAIQSGTSGAISWGSAPQRIHVLDFGANTSITLSFTNVAVGGIYTLRVTGNSGTDTLIWPASAKFEDGTSAGTVTLQDGGQMFTFYWDGTNYWVK